MFGRLVAGLLVVGLAIGVWALWPRDDPEPSQTTLPEAADTTTTTTTPADTTTTVVPTSTTTGGAGVVTTVEEAEQILRDLWFGWFEGIYNEDEERIREVVASQSQLDAAIAQFGLMEFNGPPTRAGLNFLGTELLYTDSDCLAVWADFSIGFRNAETTGVHLMRWTDTGWKLVNLWPLRDDLWEQDCEAQLEPLS